VVTRPTWDQYGMLLAEQAAKRSTCSRLHVGSVIMLNEQVVSTGYNGAPKGMSHCVHTTDTPCEISVHAEVNALLHDSSAWDYGMNKVMYVTHSPCYGCAKLILNTDVWRVVYGEDYGSGSGLTLLEKGDVEVERVA
jgi:dCMP deaminase